MSPFAIVMRDLGIVAAALVVLFLAMCAVAGVFGRRPDYTERSERQPPE